MTIALLLARGWILSRSILNMRQSVCHRRHIVRSSANMLGRARHVELRSEWMLPWRLGVRCSRGLLLTS